MPMNRLTTVAMLSLSIAGSAQQTTGQHSGRGTQKPVTGVTNKTQTAPKPAMVTHQAIAAGAFKDYISVQPVDLKPMLLSAEGRVLVSGAAKPDAAAPGPGVQAWVLNELQVEVVYTLPDDSAVATMILLQDKNGVPRPFPLSVGKGVETYSEHRVLVSGDFCQALSSEAHQSCSSGLLAYSDSDPVVGQDGLLYSTDGMSSVTAKVEQVGQSWARIAFIADPSFQPQILVLSGKMGTKTFTYKMAPPETISDAVYRASDFDLICPGRTNPAKPQLPQTCAPTDLPLTITPVSPSQVQIAYLSNDADLLFTRVYSQGGELPEVLLVHSKDGNHTVLARRLTAPANDQALLNIHMTIMDQQEVHRNYGPNIAEHYVAVKLDVKNRTAKKLQFDKSAIWFDVDLKETRGPRALSGYDLLSKATLDGVPSHVYNAPFVAEVCTSLLQKNCLNKNNAPLKIYRFGIEQNETFHPDSYLSILGAFDFAVEKSNRLFDYVQLFGGLLTTIATGGSVAQIHNFAFRDAANIFAGVFLPGYRSTTLDVAGTNRLRANLVEQTLQETIPVPPNGFAATIVLLPRDAMLDVAGYSTPVVIDRVLGVHIDPDVLNGVKEPPVPPNHVEVGYTKDQVKQALGDPPNVTTDDAGVTIYTYKTGAYVTVTFDKTGKVTGSTQRSLTEQLTAANTLAEARALLMAAAASSNTLTLVNKHMILVDVPGVTKVPEYDENGKRVGDYTLLYDSLKALVKAGTTKSSFEAQLKAQVPSGTVLLPGSGLSTGPASWTYPMPDVQGGQMVVTFVSGTAATSVPKTITFTGEMARSAGGS